MPQSYLYVKKFFSLSWRRKRDFCSALLKLSIITLQIKCRSAAWFWQKLTVATPEEGERKDNHLALVSIAKDLHETVRLASRVLPFACECVPRSIVLRSMLQNKGVDAEVKVGVKKSDINLQSHAWVEVNGEAIEEKANLEQTFKQIDPKQ